MSSYQEQKTLNVRQRQFAIAKEGDGKRVLRTGFLGPCVAFYGVNASKGVAFMSHVDGKICGLKTLVEQLKHDADGDLRGFSLFLTTNYTFTLRIIALVLIAVLLWVYGTGPWWLSALFFLMPAAFCFASIAQIYWLARIRFKTWKVLLNNPWQVSGRVEVSIDASSKTGPNNPIKESRSEDDSKDLFGSAPAYYWCAEMKPVPRD